MDRKSPDEIYKEASKDIVKLSGEVLKIEKEYLMDMRRQGIFNDLLKLFKREISE